MLGFRWLFALTYINYWTENSSNDSSAEVHGAAVMYYIPTGRKDRKKDAGLIANGLVLFVICSRNLERRRVSPSSWRRPVGT